MNRQIDWATITVPLDVSAISAPPDFVRRWLSYTRLETGVIFHCQTLAGEEVDFRIDVYGADVFRFRLNREGLRPGPTELLAESDWPPVPFDVDVQADRLELELVGSAAGRSSGVSSTV